MESSDTLQTQATESSGVVLETPRLRLRQLVEADAPFILRLLNEPSWLRFIGDRGVRTLDDAKGYIRNGPRQMYASAGFGLWLVELRESGAAVGMCGLLRRATLPDVDIGFAFLPEHWGQGYAYEAAEATLRYGRDAHGLTRIAAITLPDNTSSRKLLARLGMVCERTVHLPNDPAELLYYATTASFLTPS